jgi:hypothetical protein
MVTAGSRGQTILIMAILFAVIVLTTVILLNTLHAPADVQTQSQASGLEDIERTQAQVIADMERLFLVHTSVNATGEALPYAKATGGPDSPFGEVVENTSELNAALTASESGAVVSVSYNATHSQDGGFVRQSENDTFESTGGAEDWTVLAGADRLPRFRMNVVDGPSSSDPFQVEVDSNTEIGFSQSGVEVAGVDRAGVDCELDYPIQVDATAGVVTVSNATEVCGTFDLDLPDTTFDLEFEHGSRAEGTYAISGVGATAGAAPQTNNSVVVNPAFDVEYTDPAITHNATVTLYNETSP